MAWQILYRRNGHWLPGKTHQQKKDATDQPFVNGSGRRSMDIN